MFGHCEAGAEAISCAASGERCEIASLRLAMTIACDTKTQYPFRSVPRGPFGVLRLLVNDMEVMPRAPVAR